MAQQRLYGIFSTNPETNCPQWCISREKRRALRIGRRDKGLVLSMPLPYGNGPWDAPTFRAVADKVEADYRPQQE